MSSTEVLNKAEGDLNRKWQSEPIDETSQKLMES